MVETDRERRGATPRCGPGPIVVTGGAGFIGCALAQHLVDAGEGDVWVADNLHPQVHPASRVPAALPNAVTFVPFDVTQESAWDALLGVAEPRAIVHLAAETGTGQSLTEASRHALVNVVGTTRLLDALTRARRRPDHIVLASSRAVYGEGLWLSGEVAVSPGARRHEDLAQGCWLPADLHRPRPRAARADLTPPNPTSVYGATKLAQEHLLRSWTAAMGTRLSIVRLQNVYGPGQSLTNAYTGIVTLFARQARARATIELFEDGEIIRDFVFVDDVVDALARCLADPPERERLLDIGSGVPTTISDLGTALAQIYGAPPPVVSGRFRDGDVRAAWADVALATREIGFRPSVDLHDGLARLLTWMEQAPDA